MYATSTARLTSSSSLLAAAAVGTAEAEEEVKAAAAAVPRWQMSCGCGLRGGGRAFNRGRQNAAPWSTDRKVFYYQFLSKNSKSTLCERKSKKIARSSKNIGPLPPSPLNFICYGLASGSTDRPTHSHRKLMRCIVGTLQKLIILTSQLLKFRLGS